MFHQKLSPLYFRGKATLCGKIWENKTSRAFIIETQKQDRHASVHLQGLACLMCGGTADPGANSGPLKRYELSSSRHLFPGSCFFQEDNVRPHSAQFTRAWLQRHRYACLTGLPAAQFCLPLKRYGTSTKAGSVGPVHTLLSRPHLPSKLKANSFNKPKKKQSTSSWLKMILRKEWNNNVHTVSFHLWEMFSLCSNYELLKNISDAKFLH